jgi:hypothetical protein
MKLGNLLSSSKRWKSATAALRAEIAETRMLSAQAAIRQITSAGVLPKLAEAELRVHSQFGDDGIIQYLVRLLNVEPTSFVEFGVENYTEANTRFLLVNNNWRGLILVAAFIDRDNINGLIADNGFRGDLGILSIDIDGNDYWVWERINVVNPTIVIAEYNSVFGGSHAVTVPYDPGFYRTTAHYSNLYWGCSLKALCVLAHRKGYEFVGCNSAGNNAYFVRRDRLGPLKPLSSEAGYVESRFRESRDADGRLTFLSGDARRQAIAHMSVVDVESGETVTVGSL